MSDRHSWMWSVMEVVRSQRNRFSTSIWSTRNPKKRWNYQNLKLFTKGQVVPSCPFLFHSSICHSSCHHDSSAPTPLLPPAVVSPVFRTRGPTQEPRTGKRESENYTHEFLRCLRTKWWNTLFKWKVTYLYIKVCVYVCFNTECLVRPKRNRPWFVKVLFTFVSL